MHIDIVKLHEWIRPNMMASRNAPGELFRDNELDTIMQHHRAEPKRVQSYRQWLADNPEQHRAEATLAATSGATLVDQDESQNAPPPTPVPP